MFFFFFNSCIRKTLEYAKRNERVIADEDKYANFHSSLLSILPSFHGLLTFIGNSAAFYPFQMQRNIDWEYSTTEKDFSDRGFIAIATPPSRPTFLRDY